MCFRGPLVRAMLEVTLPSREKATCDTVTAGAACAGC